MLPLLLTLHFRIGPHDRVRDVVVHVLVCLT